MAFDKVIDSAVLDANLTSVADAIRAKGGTSEPLSFPDGFVNAVEGIQAGGGSGGDEFFYSIIDRSVVELIDSKMENVGQHAFQGCPQLTRVDLPNVTTIGQDAFYNCNKLSSINMPSLKTAGKEAFMSTAITEAYFPNLEITRESSGGYFSNCKSLITCKLPKAIDLFNELFFANCSSLKHVELPNVITLGGNVFKNCTSLKELNFPSFDGEVYTSDFTGCTALRKVDFAGRANFVRTNAFYDCKSLEAVIIRGDSVSTLSNANNFSTSGIGLGTGYIYVPSVLVDSYKTATNWSTFANQFRAIEDYPEICGGASA